MKWIPGQGFYLVQPIDASKPIDEIGNQKRMEIIEARLQKAELRLGFRKEPQA